MFSEANQKKGFDLIFFGQYWRVGDVGQKRGVNQEGCYAGLIEFETPRDLFRTS